MLRPLKSQLENFSDSNKAQIENAAKIEFDRNKLSRQVIDL
jgi:hypothetical protein